MLAGVKELGGAGRGTGGERELTELNPRIWYYGPVTPRHMMSSSQVMESLCFPTRVFTNAIVVDTEQKAD
jgi:hypothetical protein